MTFTPNVYPSLSVSDFERSVTFYDAVLGELGFPRCNNIEAKTIREAEYCFDELSKVLSIIEAPGYSEETTKLFTMRSTFPAKNRSVVDAFYATALKNGARDNGSKPSLREDQSYAASVLDPDGHHIEAVCQHPDD